MKIILTEHARTRLRQRGIAILLVKTAFAQPLLRKPSYPPTEIIQIIDNKRTLEIVFKEKKDVYVVITAYYL